MNEHDIDSHAYFAPENWGWKSAHFALWAKAREEDIRFAQLSPARIVNTERHRYELVCPDFSGACPAGFLTNVKEGIYPGAQVSGRFEHTASGNDQFPVTGDWVLFEMIEGTPRIHAVLERLSTLGRAQAGDTTGMQILASNIDTIFIVFALDGGRNFLLRLLERALVVARSGGLIPCIVLNKADLAPDDERSRIIEDARHAARGVPVIAVSAKMGEGLDELAAQVKRGDTVGLLGKSGVGKSALVNALGNVDSSTANSFTTGIIAAKEGTVREDDQRGRHTTTSSRLYRLPSGVLVIDSPGIRELKIWGDPDSLEGGFPEIAEIARKCKFADCAHENETGCAVRKALESGEIDAARYRSYLGLAREQAWLDRRTDEKARLEHEQKWKNISKMQREIKKERR
jgi:ribosome biogenesis GTPase / thiamine phosphate phosphatase